MHLCVCSYVSVHKSVLSECTSVCVCMCAQSSMEGFNSIHFRNTLMCEIPTLHHLWTILEYMWDLRERGGGEVVGI